MQCAQIVEDLGEVQDGPAGAEGALPQLEEQTRGPAVGVEDLEVAEGGVEHGLGDEGVDELLVDVVHVHGVPAEHEQRAVVHDGEALGVRRGSPLQRLQQPQVHAIAGLVGEEGGAAGALEQRRLGDLVADAGVGRGGEVLREAREVEGDVGGGAEGLGHGGSRCVGDGVGAQAAAEGGAAQLGAESGQGGRGVAVGVVVVVGALQVDDGATL